MTGSPQKHTEGSRSEDTHPPYPHCHQSISNTETEYERELTGPVSSTAAWSHRFTSGPCFLSAQGTVIAKNMGLILMKSTASLLFWSCICLPSMPWALTFPIPKDVHISLQFPMRSSYHAKTEAQIRSTFPSKSHCPEAMKLKAHLLTTETENNENKIQVMFQTLSCCRHCAASCHGEGMMGRQHPQPPGTWCFLQNSALLLGCWDGSLSSRMKIQVIWELLNSQYSHTRHL